MFVMYADKIRLTVRQREPVTSGSVNVYEAQFEFSPDWDGMERVAVFKAGKESRSVLLGESGECTIPWEVLVKPHIQLQAGVYGTRSGETVLPTVCTGLGMILEGVTIGADAQPPTPDLWRQELAGRGDTLSCDGLNLSLMAGDKPLSTVRIVGGGIPRPQGGLGSKGDPGNTPYIGTNGSWWIGDTDTGVPGIGIPAGGAAEQILAKKSDTDYDVHWVDAPSGGSSDLEEYDTEDGWHVRKWSNGYCEFLGRKKYTGLNVTARWGSGYVLDGSLIGGIEFPLPLVEKYNEQNSFCDCSTTAILSPVTSDDGLNKSASIGVTRFTAANGLSLTLQVYAAGRWK